MNNGGPAFPHDSNFTNEALQEKAFSHTEPGISKLDYFAARAMVLASNGNYVTADGVPLAEVAKWLFDMGAAMLAESEGRNDEGSLPNVQEGAAMQDREDTGRA